MFWFVHPCDYSELSTNFHEILDSGIKLDFGDDLDAFSIFSFTWFSAEKQGVFVYNLCGVC